MSFGDDLLQQASGVAISPDGTRIVFGGSQNGQRGLFLRSFDELEPRLIPGSENGIAPFFSPDGQWLAFFSGALGTRGAELTKIFYRRGGQMIAVSVSTVSGVTLGKPAVLFEGRYDVDPFNGDATNYDVARDGQRFIMVRPTADPARSLQQLNVVVNRYEELKRMAPPK